MKALFVHYKNKYPGGRIEFGDDYLDVYDADGAHRVSLHKNGAGQLVCRSEQLGCVDKHDLSPIPKESRLWKVGKKDVLDKEGKKVGELEAVVKDEKYDQRLESVKKYLKDGKVCSCEEITALSKGEIRFDDKQVEKN